MKRFARLFIGIAGLAAMACALTLVPQKTATGTVAAAVQVVNTPLAVTGTVNVGNQPPVNVNFPLSLNVTNPTVASQAVPLVTRDASALQPFQSECTASYDGVTNSTACLLTVVPAGKRLVIQSVSAYALLTAGLRVPIAGLSAMTSMSFPMPFSGTGGSGDYSVGGQQLTMYVEPQYAVQCFVATSGVPASYNTMRCTIQGYLVDAL